MSYAINAVYTKRISPVNTLVVATGSLIMGTLMLLPLALWLERPWLLEPETGPLMATLLLGESAAFSQAFGLIAVCFGIALIQNRAPRGGILK